MAKLREFKEGELGKAMALGESMYEEEPLSELGKLLQANQTPKEIGEQRNAYFKVVEDK